MSEERGVYKKEITMDYESYEWDMKKIFIAAHSKGYEESEEKLLEEIREVKRLIESKGKDEDSSKVIISNFYSRRKELWDLVKLR